MELLMHMIERLEGRRFLSSDSLWYEYFAEDDWSNGTATDGTTVSQPTTGPTTQPADEPEWRPANPNENQPGVGAGLPVNEAGDPYTPPLGPNDLDGLPATPPAGQGIHVEANKDITIVHIIRTNQDGSQDAIETQVPAGSNVLIINDGSGVLKVGGVLVPSNKVLQISVINLMHV
jgi:hypothetical protein